MIEPQWLSARRLGMPKTDGVGDLRIKPKVFDGGQPRSFTAFDGRDVGPTSKPEEPATMSA